jgi:hypothetical protein
MASPSHTQACDPNADIEDVLAVVRPDEPRTLLLRACLGTGAGAEEAWHEFAARTGDTKPFFEGDTTGLKGLLPLVHSGARRNGFSLDAKMWTYLRSAALREELRNGVYRDLCRDILKGLVEAEIQVIALKACALSETVYDAPAERHCHAIDLMVQADALADTTRILRRLKFRTARVAEARPGARQGFRHESGLPLIVHVGLFDPPIHPGDPEALWAASRPATVAGVAVRVLSPAHNLLHVLSAAFYDRARGNLRWICDAWLLIQTASASDWSAFVGHAQDARLELPLLAMLKYLAGPLGAPVPEDVLASLAASAPWSDRPAREAALSGAIGGVTTFHQVWARGKRSAETRRALLRFLFLPSAVYLQWRFAAEGRARLPLLYAYRPLAYLAQRLWWRGLKLPGLNRFTYYRRVVAQMEKLRA